MSRALVRRLLVGQISSGIFREASVFMRAELRMAAMPWPMRSAPRMSMASLICSGPPVSPAWADQMQALLCREAVGAAKFRERQREFVAAEAEGDDSVVAKVGGEVGDFHGGSRAELADGVEDELDLRAAFWIGDGCGMLEDIRGWRGNLRRHFVCEGA